MKSIGEITMKMPSDVVTIIPKAEKKSVKKSVNFFEWCRVNGFHIDITVSENYAIHSASFRDFTEIKEHGVLTCVRGYGDSPEAAIRNLASEISNKTIVTNAYRDNCKEDTCPDFIFED